MVTSTWFNQLCVRGNEQKSLYLDLLCLNSCVHQLFIFISLMYTLSKSLQLFVYCSVQSNSRLVGFNSFWKFQCMIHISIMANECFIVTSSNLDSHWSIFSLSKFCIDRGAVSNWILDRMIVNNVGTILASAWALVHHSALDVLLLHKKGECIHVNWYTNTNMTTFQN